MIILETQGVVLSVQPSPRRLSLAPAGADCKSPRYTLTVYDRLSVLFIVVNILIVVNFLIAVVT